VVTLVNTNPKVGSVVTVQGGAYGEHLITSVAMGKRSQRVNGRSFDVKLAPGCGAQLEIGMQRYAGKPTLKFPWSESRTN
jgi:hypothetical protein